LAFGHYTTYSQKYSFSFDDVINHFHITYNLFSPKKTIISN